MNKNRSQKRKKNKNKRKNVARDNLFTTSRDIGADDQRELFLETTTTSRFVSRDHIITLQDLNLKGEV